MEALGDGVEVSGARGFGEGGGEATAEGVEPCAHAGGERGGARDEGDLIDSEARGFEAGAVFIGRGVEPRDEARGVGDAAEFEFGDEGNDDGGDVAMSPEFGDETAAGFEGAVDGGDSGVGGGLDPVKGRRC